MFISVVTIKSLIRRLELGVSRKDNLCLFKSLTINSLVRSLELGE